MAMTSHKTLAAYADVIGFESTVALAGFFGGSGVNLYVPSAAEPDHLISKLIGLEAFSKLVDTYGGQRLPIPALDLGALRNAGRVWELRQRNVSCKASANLLGLTAERVRQISEQLRREGFFDLATETENEEI